MAVAALALAAAVGTVVMSPPAGAADGFVIANSLNGKCLDVLGFNTSDGATIGQWSCNGASNQRWRVEPIDGNSQVVRIRSVFSGKCMDVLGFHYEPGAQVGQWTCNGADNQTFIWVLGYDGYYFAHPLNHLDYCVDVLGANNNDGASLGLWPCTGAANQRFIVSPF